MIGKEQNFKTISQQFVSTTAYQSCKSYYKVHENALIMFLFFVILRAVAR